MDDKRFFLERFVKENPDSKLIVFVRTRVRAERVAKAMERVQIRSFTIHGAKDQYDRTDVMKKFKNGVFNILIATDVSARGIDIPNVDYVINYDLPEKSENYVHRVGRTGRAFNKGIAISYCSNEEKERLEEIEQFLNKKIEVINITKKEYAETLELPIGGGSIEDLISANEEWEKKKKKKNRKKKNR